MTNMRVWELECICIDDCWRSRVVPGAVSRRSFSALVQVRVEE